MVEEALRWRKVDEGRGASGGEGGSAVEDVIVGGVMGGLEGGGGGLTPCVEGSGGGCVGDAM